MSVPAAFDYHVAQSVDEAIALMQQYGDDAKFLAGGHSLLPTMKLRLAQPAHLIDLGRIQGLSYLREEDGAVLDEEEARAELMEWVRVGRSAVAKKGSEGPGEGENLRGPEPTTLA